jgi:hypothetical protein
VDGMLVQELFAFAQNLRVQCHSVAYVAARSGRSV